MLPLPFRQKPGPRYHLASASLPISEKSTKSASLPLEGTLYDSISLTNFLDVETHALTASIQKTIPSNALSKLLDADLPARVTLSAKPGTIGSDGAKWNPSGKAALSIRLLDLGTSDTRQKGFLKFKMSVRTNGRRDHGFEIDRKVQLFNLPNTTLYGNVAYKTNNKIDEWKTMSSFGLHQDIHVAGFKFAARAGLTPEGEFVYDLKL